jgi:hypothetical protein
METHPPAQAPDFTGEGLRGTEAPMPTEPAPLMLSDLVRQAVAICDPDGDDPALVELEEQYEDADEPVTAIASLEERIRWGADEDPGVQLAQAVVLHLAHRRSDVGDDNDEILRHAIRDEWHGEAPAEVSQWLEERGVQL